MGCQMCPKGPFYPFFLQHSEKVSYFSFEADLTPPPPNRVRLKTPFLCSRMDTKLKLDRQ